ncbi:hypothetical protein DFJ74DRAFT_682325 [Hyaloraphidium curvatum]|nr:hypothetical protein DFJ74DRAFT_682325 [Hyaloraphidium curvatum]
MAPSWPIPLPSDRLPDSAGGGPRFVYNAIDAVEADARDLATIKRGERLVSLQLERWSQGKFHILEFMLDWLTVKPEAECLWFRRRTYSYREVNQISNRIFHYSRDVLGLQKNGIAGMLLQNCPEFVFLQVGLAKLKVAQAWLNYNLRGASFLGCLAIAAPPVLFFETATAGHIIEAMDGLLAAKPPVRLVLFDNEDGAARIVPEIEKRGGKVDVITERSLEAYSDSEPDPEIRRKGTTANDLNALIYTSGTTGLPKATRSRFSSGGAAALSWCLTGYLNERDRFYQPLPLFHASGQIGLATSFILGIPFIIARKFSTSGFFPEAIESRATAFQYIGEVNRYLYALPPSPNDRAHKIRTAIGNGMRPDIFAGFKERFGIDTILEFYGASDGNVLTQILHTPTSPPEALGAVGFYGPLYDQLVGAVRIVKFDVQSEMPVRDADGFCIPCAWGETGEVLGRLLYKDDPANKLGVEGFGGYEGNKSASDKKILHDCFAKGDRWLRMGDLLRRDYPGWLYFVDRIGDTFRWKGENVSTQEVGNVVASHPAVLDANVYGVQVPSMDGRAGMALLVVDPGKKGLEATLEDLGRFVDERLPHYAVPKFLRVAPEIELTATFKNRKVEYQKEGFDPQIVGDPMFWFDPDRKTYVRFGEREHALVAGGKARL